MPKSVIAPVTPEMLSWARKRCNFDLIYVSRANSIRMEDLEQWEAGETKPTLAQLRKLSDFYKTPLEAFFLPKPPSEYDPPFTIMNLQDFRRLPDSIPGEFSPPLSLEIRAAIDRRAAIFDLMQQLDEPKPEFRLAAYRNEAPSSLARRVRAILSIDLEEQISWKDASNALKNWIGAVENVGVLVFHTGVFGSKAGISVSEMRGIALSFPSLPIIIVNSKDAEVARIFTLMHEFCHVLRNVSAINDVVEGTWSSASADDEIELYCNEFAAEMLVPIQALKEDVRVKNFRPNTIWDDEEITDIAQRFNVSREVILRRLMSVNLVSFDFLVKKRAEYSEQKKISPNYPVPYDTKLLKWHGESYVSTVLRAYHSNLISQSDAADYLSARIRWVEKLERRLLS